MLEETYVGMDVGRFADATAFCVISKDLQTERRTLVYVKELRNTAFEAQYGWVVRINNYFRPQKIFIDATGVGLAVAEHIKKIGLPAESIPFTLQRKQEMAVELKRLFEKKLIKIPLHKKLISQLCDLQFELTERGEIKLPDQGKPTDLLWALCLACFASGQSSYIPSVARFVKPKW